MAYSLFNHLLLYILQAFVHQNQTNTTAQSFRIKHWFQSEGTSIGLEAALFYHHNQDTKRMKEFCIDYVFTYV